jgi:hypothetical protein
MRAALVAGHPDTIAQFPAGTRTAVDAAAVGCTIGQIAQSVAFGVHQLNVAGTTSLIGAARAATRSDAEIEFPLGNPAATNCAGLRQVRANALFGRKRQRNAGGQVRTRS